MAVPLTWISYIGERVFLLSVSVLGWYNILAMSILRIGYIFQLCDRFTFALDSFCYRFARFVIPCPRMGGGKQAKVQFLSAMYLEWAECTGKFRSWIAHSLSDVDIVRQLQAYNILPLPPDSPFVKDGNYSSDNDHNNGRSSTIRYAPLCL